MRIIRELPPAETAWTPRTVTSRETYWSLEVLKSAWPDPTIGDHFKSDDAAGTSTYIVTHEPVETERSWKIRAAQLGYTPRRRPAPADHFTDRLPGPTVTRTWDEIETRERVDEHDDDPAITAKEIIDRLLELPWQERAEVLAAVRHNDIFCAECGIGDPESPNPSCQCRNDE